MKEKQSTAREAVLDQIKNYAVRMNLLNPDPEIDESDTLEQLGFDSLEVCQMIMDTEDEFEIEIPDNDWTTVGKVLDVVTPIVERQWEDEKRKSS